MVVVGWWLVGSFMTTVRRRLGGLGDSGDGDGCCGPKALLVRSATRW